MNIIEASRREIIKNKSRSREKEEMRWRGSFLIYNERELWRGERKGRERERVSCC